MDHPSKEWKEIKTEDLLKEKQGKKILDHHFRLSYLSLNKICSCGAMDSTLVSGTEDLGSTPSGSASFSKGCSVLT